MPLIRAWSVDTIWLRVKSSPMTRLKERRRLSPTVKPRFATPPPARGRGAASSTVKLNFRQIIWRLSIQVRTWQSRNHSQ